MLSSKVVVGLLKLLELVDHNGNVRLVDADEIRMVEQSLDRQELLLFLLLDNPNVLAKLDQIPIKLLLGFLFLLLSENEIDFVPHAHALVLLLIVDSVGLRVCWFPLNEPVHLIPLFIHRFLGRNQLFELVD